MLQLKMPSSLLRGGELRRPLRLDSVCSCDVSPPRVSASVRRSVLLWVGLLGVCLLFNPALLGVGSPTLLIKGRVLPAPGETRLPGMVLLTLQAVGSVYENSKMASRDGTFEFPSVPCVSYRLLAEAEGYRAAAVELYEQGSLGGTRYVNVTMGPRAVDSDPPQDNQAQVVDARTLEVPRKAVLEYQRGLQEQARNNLDRAEKHFKKATEIYPEFCAAYNCLALVQLKRGRRDAAEEAFLKSISINPEGKNAQKNLGFLYLSTGRVKEAVNPLMHAVELDPTDANTHAFLGETLYQLRRYVEAEVSLKKALAIDPEAFRASYRLGYVYVELKRYPEALLRFRQFLQTNQGMDSEKVKSIVSQLEVALEK